MAVGIVIVAVDRALLNAIEGVVAQSPFRRMVTPGGFQMSVAMTNCGRVGWVTDRTGYRYDPHDPETGAPWPAMPDVFRTLAREAASDAGFDGFRVMLFQQQGGLRQATGEDAGLELSPKFFITLLPAKLNSSQVCSAATACVQVTTRIVRVWAWTVTVTPLT